MLVALRRPTQDNSYLWHIEAGIRQIDLGSVLTADPFTFTARGEHWRTQSWLIELLYGWMENLRPLLSAQIVVGVAGIVLLGAIGLRVASGRGLMGPLATIWVMWLTLGYFTARPVFPSLALFAVLTLVVDVPRLRWTIPLLFWAWASAHGGFFIGLGYLVLQGIRQRDRRLLLDVVAGCVAASLTAHGWGTWETLLEFAGSSSNLSMISEWLPPDFVSLPHFPFLLGLVGIILLAVWDRVEPRDLWVAIPFVLLAFSANRSVPMAAIAIVAFLFPTFASRIGQTPFSWPLTVTALAAIVVIPLLVEVDENQFEKRFPVIASHYLDPIRTFHDDKTGGFLIYSGFPHVFIDDRAELFGETYREFVDARAAVPGWEDLFEDYQLKQALVGVEDPILSVLDEAGWDHVFADQNFVVLKGPG